MKDNTITGPLIFSINSAVLYSRPWYMKCICGKQLSDLNQHNRQLHLSTCKINLSSNKKRQSNLSNFFSKKVKTDVDAEVQSVVNNLIGRVVEINDLDTDFTVEPVLDADPFEVIDLENNIVEEAQSTKSLKDVTFAEVSEIHLSQCNRFHPKIVKLFENFPFQLMPMLPTIVPSGSSFHDVSCKDACFKLNEGSID